MITLKEIRDLNPCYDPAKYLPEDWQGTVSDLLKVEDCPESDRIWVAVRLIDSKTAHLFAVWCAREALALVPSPDPRSLAACDVAERYARGQATIDELKVAIEAADKAAMVARTARVVAESTAVVAELSAGTAARAAMVVTTSDAEAAWAATRVAGAAAETAELAAWYARATAEAAMDAWSARQKQLNKLLEMLG